MTSSTTSPSVTRSPVIVASAPSPTAAATAARSDAIPAPVLALTATGCTPSSRATEATAPGTSRIRSH
eukprot:12584863-Prorocentrum_lima.AAC.1